MTATDYDGTECMVVVNYFLSGYLRALTWTCSAFQRALALFKFLHEHERSTILCTDIVFPDH